MYNNKIFVNKFKEVTEFSDTLHNFVLVNNQININENVINIYNHYDKHLRDVYKKFVECGELSKNSKDVLQCINKFGEEFDVLRSDISKKIEKDNRKE